MTRAAVVIVQVLGWLLLAEGAARLAEWLRPGAEDIAFDYAPYRMLRMVRAPWPLDREGFRARELETYRGSFLVEFLGGSVCLGVGTNAGRTVPERLEETLHAAGLARAAVLNLCQGGATTAQELAIFIEYGLPLEPAVVLSFDGANDLMHPRPIGEDDGPNLPYRNAEMRVQFNGHHSWVAHLALTRVASRLLGRTPAPGPTGAVAADEILRSYLYTLSVTRSLAQSRGALYAVLFQPTLHFAKTWSREETNMWRERRPRDGEETSRRAAALYRMAVPALTQWGRANRTQVLDLTRVYENTSATVYSDSVHFIGERGYAMLSSEIERQGLIDEIARRYRDWERSPRRLNATIWAPQP